MGENGGAPHSESTPKPKSDLKNKRLTPTILMTLGSSDKSKLDARPHLRGGSPCFRRSPSEARWHVCGCVALSSLATWPSGFGPDPGLDLSGAAGSLIWQPQPRTRVQLFSTWGPPAPALKILQQPLLPRRPFIRAPSAHSINLRLSNCRRAPFYSHLCGKSEA